MFTQHKKRTPAQRSRVVDPIVKAEKKGQRINNII